MFNQICINEEMLPKYIHTHIYIYIYIQILQATIFNWLVINKYLKIIKSNLLCMRFLLFYKKDSTQQMKFNIFFIRINRTIFFNLIFIIYLSLFNVHKFILGRVCVPIDPQEVDKFDPFAVPTIS